MLLRVAKSLLAAVLAAASIAGCSSGGSEGPATGLVIEPPSADVQVGETVSFAALLDGANGAPVAWSVEEPDGGSIDPSGQYLAPVRDGTYHVAATLDATGARARAEVRVGSHRRVTVSPSSATVEPGGSVAFAASAAAAVTWTVVEGSAGGSISSTGLYTSPSTAGTYHIVAQSVADPSKTGQATVTVTSAPPPPPPPTGPQFYVSTAGNDSSAGTLAQPWRTIQKAMNSATPGSTVNIMAGTYREQLRMNVQGTAGNYITFQPYRFSVPASGCGGWTGVACGGDQVILDYAHLGTYTGGVPFLAINSKSYVRVQGLTFQNLTCTGPMQQGLRIDGSSSYIELKYNKFLNNRNIGEFLATALLHIRIWGPAHHVVFYGNEVGRVWSTASEAFTADNGASYLTVEDNYFHDTDQIAIDMHQGANNFVIRGNKVQYCAKKPDGSYFYNSQSACIYSDGGNTGVIEQNLVLDSGYGIQALSEPSMVSRGNLAHHITIRNNVVARSFAGVLIGTWYSTTDGSSVRDIQVLNNTFVGNTHGVYLRPFTSSSVVWKNNIVANNGTNYANPLGWNPGTMDYNLYYGGNSGPDAHRVTSDPRFTNPGAGNYSLQATSPAIDAGDPAASTGAVGTVDYDVNPRIVGGRVDVGAFEAQ